MKNKNKLVCGIGVNDSVEPVTIEGNSIKSYQHWRGMLERCYSRNLLSIIQL